MQLDSLWSNVFKRKGDESEEALAIKNVPVFEGLTDKEVASIEKVVHKRTYSDEEHIFREGDPGGGMYIILQGGVAIVKGEGSGTKKTLAELKEGDFFGELALLDESPRSASAVSKGESRILGFYRTDLLEIVDRKPKLAVSIVVNLAKVVGERLRHSNAQSHMMRVRISELEGTQNPEPAGAD